MAGMIYGDRLGSFQKFSGEGNPFYGKMHTEDSRRKMTEAKTGEKSPCYGKIWINNGEINKRILPEEFCNYEEQGYIIGRKLSEEQRKNHKAAMLKRNRDEKGRYC